MKKLSIQVLSVAIYTSIVAAWLFPGVAAAGDCDAWLAKIVSVQGEVQAKRNGETQWEPVKIDDTFCAGDMLRVQEKSRAAVVLSNETVARLDQKTSITFTGIEDKKVSVIDIIKGVAHFFSRVPRSLKVTTPFVNGAVEGTEFFVEVDPDQCLICVFHGRVAASNDAGSLSLVSGQSAITRAGKAPEAYTVARPRDAVRWAIYYPAVIDYRAEDFPDRTGWQDRIRKSIGYYREGDLVNAFSSLEGVPENIQDHRFYTYRAGLLLTVGRVDEAGADVERVLGLDAANSHAFALKSIIAVAQNKKEEALKLANEAVAQDTSSSAAQVALSYAQQSGFQVQAALESLHKAVQLSPDDALAWARLSELQMSVGDLDKALDAARRAADLNPNLARTQTVLGFAYLARIKTKDALTAFEKAIRLDQVAPLPRLGLGLTKIREGDLKEGRAEIEIAAGLDPNNSLIRSYLGKAFFDEKRDKQSNSQLTIAKELDPQDPTPYFYDAIRKQTLNRPVEALHDIQKSIELNDNRAVYRSRMLLDEDLAARSASLGRIYNDLGFQQMALLEGYKSLNTDPSNHSAHRFLADSYVTRPRHEIARVSELLQSQLLQPLNITPVQPSLAESESFIYEGAGPADPSFNEFNPLFVRNRLALQASGIVGGNDIYGDEVVQSGVWGRMSYSIGQFHYQTDGFRDNNDLEKDIYNVFMQTSLTYKTSLQMEYRYENIEKGDLLIKFDPDNFENTFRKDEKHNSIRIGTRHSINPNSDLIASFVYEDSEEDVNQPPVLEHAADLDGYSGEIQHLLRSEKFHITSGIGYLKKEEEHERAVTIFPPPPLPPISLPLEIDEYATRHTNLYLYSQFDCLRKLFWTLGASIDFLKGSPLDLDLEKFNPKFGLTWQMFPNTTIRAAVFKTLRREFVSNQTLEPTQVAGFNQFFDDPLGTKSWRYGVALDQKFSSSIYGGLEFARRDIEVLFMSGSSRGKGDWEDDLGRAYLYWTPKNWLAFSGEYQYERLDREPDAVLEEQIVEVKTHRVPLGISFFNTLGFIARLKATYVDQDGEFGNPSLGFVSGDDNFWVVDASLGYRLPRRLGIVTFEAKNLFDEEFYFQDTDPSNPHITPESLIFARLTLAF